MTESVETDKYAKHNYTELCDMDKSDLKDVLEYNKKAYAEEQAEKQALISQILWLQDQVG